MFEALRTAIENKLLTVTTITQVFAHESAKPDSFPYATVALVGNTSEYADTATDLRKYRFRVRMYMKIGDTAPLDGDDAELSMSRTVEAVLNAFDTDYTLGGACQGVDASESTVGWTDTANGRCRVGEIILTCQKLVQVVS
jgi:hypothetical protein